MGVYKEWKCQPGTSPWVQAVMSCVCNTCHYVYNIIYISFQCLGWGSLATKVGLQTITLIKYTLQSVCREVISKAEVYFFLNASGLIYNSFSFVFTIPLLISLLRKKEHILGRLTYAVGWCFMTGLQALKLCAHCAVHLHEVKPGLTTPLLHY